MSRAQALNQIRPLLFSTALLAALLGFGVFFDYLADRHEAAQPDTMRAAMNEESDI
ncbi:MAG: hypothetical protein HY854_19615 [Burkholderiales bacterium]|nr:hypothetical protein [Burkholderiales bacterium]